MNVQSKKRRCYKVMTELIEFNAAVQQVMGSARTRPPEFPLHPLLYVAGAAAAVAGLYYYYKKKREDDKKTAEFKNTPLIEDLVKMFFVLDPGWRPVEATHSVSIVPELTPEEMYQQVIKSNAQLEHEKLNLMSQVDTLQGSLRKLEEKLSDSCRIRDETLRKLVIGKGILKFVKSTAALQAKTLNQRAESLQVSLDEVQNKYNEAMQTIRNQEGLQRDLESEINGQQEIIQDLEEELSEIKSSCSIATAEMGRLSRNLSDLDSKWNLLNDTVLTNYSELSEDHLKLFRQYNELKEEHDKLQEITQVEAVAAFKQLMVSNAQLEKEKSKLMYHLHKLKGRVRQLEEMLYEADITCVVLKQDRERAEEAYSILMSQYRETFKQRNELLKASLAETEKKLRRAAESGAQLSYVNILRSSVQKWEKELSEICRRCEKRTRERRKKQEEHTILKTQYNEIMDILKQCDEFLKNHHSDLKSKEPVVL